MAQKSAFSQVTQQQAEKLNQVKSDITKMFDKSGNVQFAVQHITGANEDAWCREKEAKTAGFKFGKKIFAKDKITEYKRKRDLK
jgi:hypothetical protein